MIGLEAAKVIAGDADHRQFGNQGAANLNTRGAAKLIALVGVPLAAGGPAGARGQEGRRRDRMDPLERRTYAPKRTTCPQLQ